MVNPAETFYSSYYLKSVFLFFRTGFLNPMRAFQPHFLSDPSHDSFKIIRFPGGYSIRQHKLSSVFLVFFFREIASFTSMKQSIKREKKKVI